MPANRNQPITSLAAADEMAITPVSVRVSEYSRKMRPRIGTAVMARATATKSE